MTALITGSNLCAISSVKFVAAGLPDIAAESMAVSEEGKRIAAQFDLFGEATGVRDLVVRSESGDEATRPSAFTVEEHEQGRLWVRVTGRTRLFKNLSTVTAPAQEMRITDQLDAAMMDLSTLSLGAIRFGSRSVTPPPGLKEYTTEVDLRPEKNMIVRITATLDTKTRILSWLIRSLVIQRQGACQMTRPRDSSHQTPHHRRVRVGWSFRYRRKRVLQTGRPSRTQP